MAENNNMKISDTEEKDFGFPFVDVTPLKAKSSKKVEEIHEEVEDIETPAPGPIPNPAISHHVDKGLIKPTTKKEKKKSQLPMLLSLVILVVIILGAMAYFLYYLPNEDQKYQETLATIAEVEESPVLTEEEPAEDIVEAEIEEQETEQEVVEIVETPVVSAPVQSSVNAVITKVTSREPSPFYYIIVSSSPSENVAEEEAQKLVAKGLGAWIIFPYGDTRNFRVSIGKFAAYGDATAALEKAKANFDDSIWILKY